MSLGSNDLAWRLRARAINRNVVGRRRWRLLRRDMPTGRGRSRASGRSLARSVEPPWEAQFAAIARAMQAQRLASWRVSTADKGAQIHAARLAMLDPWRPPRHAGDWPPHAGQQRSRSGPTLATLAHGARITRPTLATIGARVGTARGRSPRRGCAGAAVPWASCVWGVRERIL